MPAPAGTEPRRHRAGIMTGGDRAGTEPALAGAEPAPSLHRLGPSRHQTGTKLALE